MPYGTVNADVITTSTAGGVLGAGNASIMKNRIINGAMVIDQRNAGASVTNVGGASSYSLDRWQYYASQASKFTIQQNAGSVTPPVGFVNYLGITSTSAYTVGTSEIFQLAQYIEGFNIADLGWGTANAKAITISFWVRSSLTGTFGGSLRNENTDRSYPFSYTISAANTWQQITLNIAGDTTGTWGTTNGTGIRLAFGLGMGSTFSGTAGSWQAANYISATGATSVVGTNGATFYITGVQLEVGSSATGFEYRQYTTELQLCQRYFSKIGNDGTSGEHGIATGFQQSTTGAYICIVYPVTMRTQPTATATSVQISDQVAFSSNATINSTLGTFNNSGLGFSYGANGAAFRGCCLIALNNSSGNVAFSAEL
jgi:hypothetical protein